MLDFEIKEIEMYLLFLAVVWSEVKKFRVYEFYFLSFLNWFKSLKFYAAIPKHLPPVERDSYDQIELSRERSLFLRNGMKIFNNHMNESMNRVSKV